jgi:hypothetical protein
LPIGVTSISGLFYSRYIKWRGEHLTGSRPLANEAAPVG